MQDAHNATNIENINVKEIMDGWTKQKHYPVLKVKQIHDYTNFQYIRITIENIENHWHTPVTITSQMQSNFTIHPWKIFYKWKEFHKFQESNIIWFMDLAIDCTREDWIIVNLQQIGKRYFLINYIDIF